MQYTLDIGVYVLFLFNRVTFHVFVTYLIGALHVHHLWFYIHQHDNRVRSKLFVACQRWSFQRRFWFVTSVPGYLREEHKPDPWRNPIERNHMGLHLENEVARRVVRTLTIIFNNPVLRCTYICLSYNITGVCLPTWSRSFVFRTTTLLAFLRSVVATYADQTVSCFYGPNSIG